MRQRATVIILIAAIICVFADATIFSRYTIADIRPDMLMALTVTLGFTIGSLRAGVICGAIGLFNDILFAKSIGINACIYLLAGIAAGFFFRKFYADNLIVPPIVAVVLMIAKGLAYAVITAISGVGFSFGRVLMSYILPCALMTGLVCIPVHLAMKPLLAFYTKYISEAHASRGL